MFTKKQVKRVIQLYEAGYSNDCILEVLKFDATCDKIERAEAKKAIHNKLYGDKEKRLARGRY